MLPKGNGSCFYIEKKGKQKETIIFFYIENGKTQGNVFIENSEQSMDKKSARMLPESKHRQYAKLYREKISRRETHSLRIANKVWTKNQPVCPFSPNNVVRS